MTDYFALLDQPRQPWLDQKALKESYHRKTLQTHPDAAGNSNDFAQLNEAYQVLQDPKRRLQHLLCLENRAPSANQAVPPDLEQLFLQIGALNQRTTQLLEKIRASSNPLSRSLLKQEMIAAQKEVAALRDQVRDLIGAAEELLRQTSAEQIDEISVLSQRFAYLGRWLTQLDELAFQLSL